MALAKYFEDNEELRFERMKTLVLKQTKSLTMDMTADGCKC